MVWMDMGSIVTMTGMLTAGYHVILAWAPSDGYMRTWLNDLRYDGGDIANGCLISYPLTRLDCFDLSNL